MTMSVERNEAHSIPFVESKRKAQVMQGMEKLQKESALLKQRLSVKVAHVSNDQGMTRV